MADDTTVRDDELKEQIRERYAERAREVTESAQSGELLRLRLLRRRAAGGQRRARPRALQCRGDR